MIPNNNFLSDSITIEDLHKFQSNCTVLVYKRVSSSNARATSKEDVEDSKSFKLIATHVIYLAKKRSTNDKGRIFETFHTLSFSPLPQACLEVSAQLYVKATEHYLAAVCSIDLASNSELLPQANQGFLSLDKAVYPIDNLKLWKARIAEKFKLKGNLEFAIIVFLKYSTASQKLATSLFQITKTSNENTKNAEALLQEIALHLSQLPNTNVAQPVTSIEVDLTGKKDIISINENNNANNNDITPNNDNNNAVNAATQPAFPTRPVEILAQVKTEQPSSNLLSIFLCWHFKESSGKKKPAVKSPHELSAGNPPSEVVAKVVLNPVPYIKAKRGVIKEISVEILDKEKNSAVAPETIDSIPTHFYDYSLDYYIYEHLRIPLLGQIVLQFKVKTVQQTVILLESTTIAVVSHVSQLPSRKRPLERVSTSQGSFADLSISEQNIEPPFLRMVKQPNNTMDVDRAYVKDIEPAFQIIGIPCMVRIQGYFPKSSLKYIVLFGEQEVPVLKTDVQYLFVLTPKRDFVGHSLVTVKTGSNLIGTANYWYYDWNSYISACDYVAEGHAFDPDFVQRSSLQGELKGSLEDNLNKNANVAKIQ